MRKEITFGEITVKPGEKKSGFAPVYASDFSIPLTVINGIQAGKTVVITSGIHGGEYPCIETAIELAQEIDPLTVSGQLIILHPVNIQAFQARMSYIVPEDGKNINRLFPGDKMGTISDRIAYTITTEYSDRADFYIDLHGGDIHESLPPYVYYPGIADEKVVAQSKAAAEVLNADFIVKSSATTGAYNSAAIRGIPSLLIELGGKGLWNLEEVIFYKNNITNLLRHLHLLKGPVQIPRQKAYEITKAEYIDASESGCWYPSVNLKDTVRKGQKIGQIKDVFGNTKEEIFAAYDAVILFITVSLAINANDPIITYGI
ncbi:MAG: succinylglutamate desuccinylase [Firmicutes bacterium]|nr:succinylglutamate desuccinylase [Bacillota bacterium]